MNLIKTLFLLTFTCLLSFQSEAQSTDSNSKIFKIQLEYLSENLSQSTTAVRNFNKGLLQRIEIEVKNKGNRSYDLELVDKAKKVIKLTDELLLSLNQIKTALDKNLDNKESIQFSNKLIFELNKGQEVKDLLDNYIDSINAISKNRHMKIFPELGSEYNEIELFFKNSTTVGSIGIITAFESQATEIESFELFDYAALTGTR